MDRTREPAQPAATAEPGWLELLAALGGGMVGATVVIAVGVYVYFHHGDAGMKPVALGLAFLPHLAAVATAWGVCRWRFGMPARATFAWTPACWRGVVGCTVG